MSDRLKSTNTFNNEEIVNELTKDLDTSLDMGDNKAEKDTNPVTNEENPLGNDTNLQDTENTEQKEKDFDTDHEESEEESSGTDIDEMALKDAEIELTEDQKAERRVVAEELKVQGNKAFKDQNYDISIHKYTEGLRICPLLYSQLRSVLYCNRSAARMRQENYTKAILDCDKSVELDEKYVKAYIRRAQSYEYSDKFEEALADFEKILQLDPINKDAQEAIVRLPLLIEERNEILRKDMMGKLKDLGNMILKPFGLSTSNFQLEQDSESQGYKINFKN